MKEAIEQLLGPLVVLAGIAGGLGAIWLLMRLFPQLDGTDRNEKR